MIFKKRNAVFLILSLAVMTVIFWFSSRDATESTEQSDFFILLFLKSLFESEIPIWLSVIVRKMAHFTAYAALGFCLYYVFEGLVGHLKSFICPLLVSVIYAVSDEIHQLFVPGRAGRLFDLFIDTIGASFGIAFAALVLLIIRKRRSCR